MCLPLTGHGENRFSVWRWSGREVALCPDLMAGTMLWIIILTILTLIAFCVVPAYSIYSVFKRRKIAFEPPTFPFGNLLPVFALKKSYNELLADLYRKHKEKPFVGFFQFFQKSVLIIDRDLIKNVLVKDFEYFDGKNIHYNKDLEPLTAHLFSMDGEEWKLLRMKMTPTFTSGKLKGMFGMIVNVGLDLRKYLSMLVAENDVIECKDMFIRYGLAIIASTAFGLESDVLTDKSSMFFKMSEKVTSATFEAMFRIALMFYGGPIAKAFKIRILPKDAHEFFKNLVKDTIQYRENHMKTRNDFLQLLMQLKEGAKVGGKDYSITVNEIAAQCFLFILAGFESSSNTMSFFLYEMALNPEMQKRVQQEVDAAEEITYDSVTNMEYLDMAVDETLRKYAPLGFVGRVCTKDYVVPSTGQVIEKGTNVLVSLHGLHRDPDLFPDPENFIPERFSKENKNEIKPFSYLPFGEGPRFCIGMRFGKLMIKTGLALMMKQFEVRRTHNTPVPLKFQAKTINTTAKGGMWLQFVERKCSGPENS